MAISFITGVPRSGKSYYVVYLIWKMYKNDLKKLGFLGQWYSYYFPKLPKKLYTNVYLNINEFNFDFHPNLKKLDFHSMIEDLEILHDMNVNQKLPDSVLIEKAKELGLYDSLIVVDEGAHYFTKPINQTVLWWLTYHGHIHQDIYIITQHVDQIPTDYLKNGEFFYKAYPPSKAIYQNKFSLGLYSCIKFYKTCKTEDLTIPFEKDVGNLYISGKKAVRKSVLTKYIIFFIAVILFLFLAINYFFSSNEETIKHEREKSHFSEPILEEKKTSVKSIKKIEDNNTKEVIVLEGKTVISFNCINIICNVKGKYENIPKKFITFLVENNPPYYSSVEKINYNFSRYDIFVDDEVIALLDRSFAIEVSKKDKKKNSLSKPISMF